MSGLYGTCIFHSECKYRIMKEFVQCYLYYQAHLKTQPAYFYSKTLVKVTWQESYTKAQNNVKPMHCEMYHYVPKYFAMCSIYSYFLLSKKNQKTKKNPQTQNFYKLVQFLLNCSNIMNWLLKSIGSSFYVTFLNNPIPCINLFFKYRFVAQF